MSELSTERIEQLQRYFKRFNLCINDIDLMNRSLIHSSYAFEHQLEDDNERLEFLGDAVLGLVVSDFLYREYPIAREGILSKYKATMISRSVLGKRALDMGLGDMILVGNGEELNGARVRPALLGSALEALVGALYIDIGIEAMLPFLIEQVFEPGRNLVTTEEFGDYKSKLQELVQRLYQVMPEYQLVGESGPDHSKHFEVIVLVNGTPHGKGEGSRKKIAENQAAMRAFYVIGQEEDEGEEL